MDETLLRQILDKLDKPDAKITNFMGFFDLPPKERAELKKDLRAYREGKLDAVALEEAEKFV
ncbi:MAG: hypothetical protein ACE5PM_02415 [Candidatus Hydrothermarchaeales archaeon]